MPAEHVVLGPLYHGTTEHFESFDPEKTFDGGLYFTDNLENAIEYGAMRHHDRPIFVVEVEVMLSNPLLIDFEGRVFEESVQKLLEEKIREGKESGRFDGIILENIDDLAYSQENRMVIAFRGNQIRIVSRRPAIDLIEGLECMQAEKSEGDSDSRCVRRDFA